MWLREEGDLKLVTFTTENKKEKKIGVVINDNVLDLSLSSSGKISNSMLEFIESGDYCKTIAHECIKNYKQEHLYPLSKIKLLAPILNPPSLKDFFAFEEHAKAGAKRRNEELPKEWYEIPAYYKGNHRAVFGPDDEIPWPFYTRKLDFECEIACVVGKKGKNIKIEDASDYIFGYMIFNDFSARDIQKKEMLLRLGPGKGKDFANAFGPYLVTKDEVDPQKDFSMKININNELWSSGHFKDQYWGFPLMISHISQEETVYPGDILGSGTFYKGCGLDLDRWIKEGDTIELEVPKLGILRNKIGKASNHKELNYKKQEVKN